LSRPPQSAIRGVASVGAINAVARFLAFAFHVAVTALFGLSGGLDAYFVALSIVTLVFFVLGDGFDSVGVPPLVEALQQQDRQRFREVAGALMALSAGVSVALAFFVGAVLPWVHFIAPGLGAETVPLVAGNLIRLAPLAVSYLPCRAAASVLRSQRRFSAAAGWEVVAAATTLFTILLLRRAPFAVALSTSIGALAGAVVLLLVLRDVVGWSARRLTGDMRRLAASLGALLPIYAVSQLLRVADRFFASFLPEGSISAISYGQMLVLVPGMVLALDNIFMTPLAEAKDRAPLLRSIVEGILILSVPAACFAIGFSDLAVGAAFGRGQFDAAATELTASALGGFAFGLPPLLVWPVMYRMFQILGRTHAVLRLAIMAFVLNCVLNGFAIAFGFGVRGLALATTISVYCLAAGGVLALTRELGRMVGLGTIVVALQVLAASGVGALAAWLTPSVGSRLVTLGLKGVVFVGIVAILIRFAPAEGIRVWRETVVADLAGSWRQRA